MTTTTSPTPTLDPRTLRRAGLEAFLPRSNAAERAAFLAHVINALEHPHAPPLRPTNFRDCQIFIWPKIRNLEVAVGVTVDALLHREFNRLLYIDAIGQMLADVLTARQRLDELRAMTAHLAELDAMILEARSAKGAA